MIDHWQIYLLLLKLIIIPESISTCKSDYFYGGKNCLELEKNFTE
ncbi:hypothetical protein BH23BAC1_BH23BAC1_36840 [soil metagenome]